MNRENISFYLSIIAAILSTTTAIFNIRKARKEVKSKIKIDYTISSNLTELEILIKNVSFRPVSILSFELFYGAHEDYFQTISHNHLEVPVKLNESEVYKIVYKTEDIQKNVSDKQIEQRYYHKLFVRVWTTSIGVFTYPLNIPVTESMRKNIGAEYIVTDRFLGFKEMEPFVHRKEFISRK